MLFAGDVSEQMADESLRSGKPWYAAKTVHYEDRNDSSAIRFDFSPRRSQLESA